MRESSFSFAGQFVAASTSNNKFNNRKGAGGVTTPPARSPNTSTGGTGTTTTTISGGAHSSGSSGWRYAVIPARAYGLILHVGKHLLLQAALTLLTTSAISYCGQGLALFVFQLNLFSVPLHFSL